MMQPEHVDGFRLSPQQRRAWLAGARGSAAKRSGYSPCASWFVLRLDGAVTDDILQQALGKVIARHDILRTRYRRLDGMVLPVQILGAGPSHEWRVIELRNDEALVDLLEEEGRRPFDLGGGVVRATRVTLPGEERMLVLSLPPLAVDAASIENLIRDLEKACRSVAGEGPDFDEEPISYIQFSEFQNALLEGDEGADARDFWALEELVEPPRLPLPFAPDSAVGSGGSDGPAPRLARLSRPLSSSLVTAVIASVEELERRPLAAWLLAAWQTLLWRLSGKREVVVAHSTEGRPHEIFTSAVGLFARWVPVRCEFDHSLSFREVVARIGGAQERAEEAAEGFVWAEGTSPSVGFAFERLASPVTGAWLTLQERNLMDERCGLKLTCLQRGDRLETEFAFDSERFASADVERVMGHFHCLLTGAAADVDRPVGSLTLLEPTERHCQIEEYNATDRAFPPVMGWHRWFEEQAAKTPNDSALVFEEQQLSYSQLNRRANRLARRLQREGVGPDVLVALVLERSAELVVALLATLKAGGAFVPLEPEQPSRRLAVMLEDLGTPVLLTTRDIEPRLPPFAGRSICIDVDLEEVDVDQEGDLSGEVAPEHLAYVIFTSGSTGRPKGVMVEHRQLLNYTRAALERLAFSPRASFQTVSTFAADLGNTMIFPALSTGGCLHVASRDDAADPDALAAYGERRRIDYLKIVPSHLEALLDGARPERLLPGRCLVFGGEALQPATAEAVGRLAPGCTLFNHYGPSEATVGVITHRIGERSLDPRCRSVPLGRPLANTRIYLLDPQLEPTPFWVGGELFIGGANVARGYLGLPSSTAEKFVPDLFGPAPGARLYRTGDLARRLPDGEAEFLGRVDHQVKFHGFRVELEELRGALNRYPGVRDSVVTVKPNKQGRDVLLAFYVSRHGLDVGTLREHLADLILEETLPNIFVHLRKLPLTLNGKINYRALPSVEEAQRLARRPFVAPRNKVEGVIAGIWAELLGLERVSIDDNFFELGGHSLLATRAISRQRQALAMEIPLRKLFDHPTVEEQARLVVEQQRQDAPASSLHEICHDGVSLEDQLAELEHLSDEQAMALADQEAATPTGDRGVG